MNILATFLIVLFTISLNNYQPIPVEFLETSETEELDSKNKFTINHEDYTLQFKLDNSDDQNPFLIIGIKLHNGSHYISPFATREFKGKFFMDLGSYKDIDFEGAIVETPSSVEEYDPHPFTNGTVNWVRVNTTYKQELKLKSNEDFQVFGRVRFTIEPRCTLEEIPFAISYENGTVIFIDPKC